MISELLIQTMHSYRNGLRRVDTNSPSVSARDFEALMFLGTIGWVPPRHRLPLRRLLGACGRGLRAARQGRLAESALDFSRAKEWLDELQATSRLGHLVAVSTYESAIAYLDFRCDRSKVARDRLDRSMDGDLELELEGLPVMQMHRIQQGHNIVRLEFPAGRRREALELTGLLVSYMEGRIPSLSYHHTWRPKLIQAVSRTRIQDMTYQILGETAGQIAASSNSSREWQWLIEAAPLHPDPEMAASSQAQHALRAQAALLEGDIKTYLEHLDRYFSLGIQKAPLLWYAVMAELMDYCLAAGTQLSMQAAGIIARDSAKWKGLPQHLASRFQIPAAHSFVA